jgi:hypothetical protein
MLASVKTGLEPAAEGSDHTGSMVPIDFRRFGPMPSNSPYLGQPCQACGVDFLIGDFTTLVPLGPGGDAEARERARDGRPYNAVALQVHWACATGEDR